MPRGNTAWSNLIAVAKKSPNNKPFSEYDIPYIGLNEISSRILEINNLINGRNLKTFADFSYIFSHLTVKHDITSN